MTNAGQQYPTREQIDAAVAAWVANRNGNQIDLSNVAALKDRLHALFPQPTPSAEPVAAWRDRHGDEWTEGDDGLMHTRETAPFSHEYVEKKWGPLVAVAAPPSIADMAPGTRFTAAGVDNIDRRWTTLPDGELFESDVYIVTADWLDPSTIRDVTQPTENQ